MLSRFRTYRSATTDRQTDRQTTDTIATSISRVSELTRDKNRLTFDTVIAEIKSAVFWDTMYMQTLIQTNKRCQRPAPTRTKCGRVRGTWHRGRQRRGRTSRRTCWRNASLGETGRRSWGSWSLCRRRWSVRSSVGSRRGPDAATRPPTDRPDADLHPPCSSIRPTHRLLGSSSSFMLNWTLHWGCSKMWTDRSGPNGIGLVFLSSTWPPRSKLIYDTRDVLEWVRNSYWWAYGPEVWTFCNGPVSTKAAFTFITPHRACLYIPTVPRVGYLAITWRRRS